MNHIRYGEKREQITSAIHKIQREMKSVEGEIAIGQLEKFLKDK